MSKHFECTTCQCDHVDIESITASNSDDEKIDNGFIYMPKAYNEEEMSKVIRSLLGAYISDFTDIKHKIKDLEIIETLETKKPEVKKQRGRPRKNFEIKPVVKKGISNHPEYYVDGVFNNNKYYELNKAKLKIKQQVKETCECGAICQKAKMHKHKKSRRHIQVVNRLKDLKVI